jgi:hypothetical protein
LVVDPRFIEGYYWSALSVLWVDAELGGEEWFGMSRFNNCRRFYIDSSSKQTIIYWPCFITQHLVDDDGQTGSPAIPARSLAVIRNRMRAIKTLD